MQLIFMNPHLQVGPIKQRANLCMILITDEVASRQETISRNGIALPHPRRTLLQSANLESSSIIKTLPKLWRTRYLQFSRVFIFQLKIVPAHGAREIIIIRGISCSGRSS